MHSLVCLCSDWLCFFFLSFYSQPKNVQQVTLSYNKLAGKLTDLTKVFPISLISLEIESNLLTGEVPSTLFDLPVLKELDLTANQLSSQLPANVWAGLALTSLSLSSNQLTGTLPEVVDAATKPVLISIEMTSNKIKGTIPVSFAKMSELHSLELNQNFLTGTIPENLAAFRILKLNFNQLTGMVPELLTGSSAFFLANQTTPANRDALCSMEKLDCSATSNDCAFLPKCLAIEEVDCTAEDKQACLHNCLAPKVSLPKCYNHYVKRACDCEVASPIPTPIPGGPTPTPMCGASEDCALCLSSPTCEEHHCVWTEANQVQCANVVPDDKKKGDDKVR